MNCPDSAKLREETICVAGTPTSSEKRPKLPARTFCSQGLQSRHIRQATREPDAERADSRAIGK